MYHTLSINIVLISIPFCSSTHRKTVHQQQPLVSPPPQRRTNCLITAFDTKHMPAPPPSPSSTQAPPQPPPSPPNIRNAFDPRPLKGMDLAAARLESVAVTGEGRRLWVGTSDGYVSCFQVYLSSFPCVGIYV